MCSLSYRNSIHNRKSLISPPLARAIFTYDGVTNKLKLADSGAGGVAELAEKFHISKPQYGLCKVESVEAGGPRIAMISWSYRKQRRENTEFTLGINL
ncbi:Drebrin-like protein B [Liparis tanakae]|uniref:Drebrin-like protein B n=1 Tax=Liparis tanakae TaxID=230148 RepID=A0A4Z2HMC5_9TELE|nr:Drebrin-like protein B [Liparis tanakae]